MLKISLRPSRLLAAILLIAHAGAIAIVLMLSFPLWSQLAATALLIAQCLLVVRRQALLMGMDAAVAIEITSDHKLNLQTRALGWCEYDVLGSTFVSPYLTVLSLRQPGRGIARYVPLLADSLHMEDFRKLRVWLRWKEDNTKT